MTKKSVQSVMNERTLLAGLTHPFVVNMHYAFQDRETLYLVMDLMPGGDLRYHIGNKKRFTEIQASKTIGTQNSLSRASCWDLSTCTAGTSSTGTSNQKTSYLTQRDMSESQT